MSAAQITLETHDGFFRIADNLGRAVYADRTLPHFTNQPLSKTTIPAGQPVEVSVPSDPGRPETLLRIRLENKGNNGWILHLESPEASGFFGMGMNFARFHVNNARYTLKNTDSPYFMQRWFSYAGIPYFFSRQGWGAFLLDASPVKVQFREGRTVSISGIKHLDFFIFSGGVRGAIRTFTGLTGRPPLPPKWTLGLWNTSFPVLDQKDTLAFIDSFHQRRIPLETVVLDYHWEEKFHNFRWSPRLFPDPSGFLAEARARGVKIGLITTPFINKKEHFWFRLFVRMISGHNTPAVFSLFERYSEPRMYADWEKRRLFAHKDAPWWFGRGGMLDFTNPDTEKAWGEEAAQLLDSGIAFFKNDDGEYLPADAESAAGIPPDEHHNVYGLYYSGSMYKTVEAVHGRGLVYARSVWAGGQRFPGLFLGDQQPTEGGMRRSLNAGLSLSAGGFSWWTADLYGLAGRVPKKMHARYLQYAAFSPIVRYFSSPFDSTRAPWHYGPEGERLFRSVIRTRYRLIPHYYSLGYQAQETGLPIVRSLEMVDPSARSAETQDGHASYFFVGDDMLVVCAKKARLPRGVWFNVRTGGVESAGTPVTWQDGPIPVFLRAPSMLPTARPSLTVVPGTHNKTIKVLCVPGGRAVYDLYDDDGEGSAYRNGEFSLTRLEGICERASVTLTVTRTGGSLETDRAFVFAIPGVRSLGHNAPAGQSGTAQWRYHRSRSILMVRFSPHKDAQQTFHLSGIDINPAFFA